MLTAAEYRNIVTLSRDTSGGHWITIHSGETGEGTHVYIEGGRITKGPAALTGKNLGELHKAGHHVSEVHGEKHPETGTKEGPTATPPPAQDSPKKEAGEKPAPSAKEYGEGKGKANTLYVATGGKDLRGGASFFTADKKYAANYGDYVHKVKVPVGKTFDIRHLGSGDVERSEVVKSLAKHGIKIDENKLGVGEIHQVLQPARAEIARQGQALGFSGWRQLENYDGMEAETFYLFDPKFDRIHTEDRYGKKLNLSASAYAARKSNVIQLSAVDLMPSATESPRVPAKFNGADLKLYWADALHAGTLTHPKTGQKLNFTSDRLDKLASNLSRTIANGVEVPICKDHRESADSVVGYVLDAKREGDKLMVLHGIFADQESLALKNRISLGIDPNYRDGRGNIYGEAIRHSALTPIPVQPQQSGFTKAA